MRSLFAAQAAAHRGRSGPDEVSASDVEAQLLREFYKVTILSRLEKLANGELGRRLLINVGDQRPQPEPASQGKRAAQQ